jgi:hypothetical protein
MSTASNRLPAMTTSPACVSPDALIHPPLQIIQKNLPSKPKSNNPPKKISNLNEFPAIILRIVSFAVKSNTITGLLEKKEKIMDNKASGECLPETVLIGSTLVPVKTGILAVCGNTGMLSAAPFFLWLFGGKPPRV